MNPMKQQSLVGAVLLGLGLCASAGPFQGAAPAVEPSLAISATHLLIEGDTVMDDGVVLIGGGKILTVGTQADLLGTLPSGLHVIEHDGWLSTGLTAANGTMGLSSTDDSTGAFMERLQLSSAFDPDSKGLLAARNLGITSFGLVSGRSNVIGGVGAVVKTDGTVLKERASLSICLAPPALRSNRFPTSYGGALQALRERISASTGSLASATNDKGRLPVQLAVNSRAEIARAIAFTKEVGFRAILRGARRAGEFAQDLKDAKISVAFGPLGLGVSPQSTASMMELSKAGVPFAFGLADTRSASTLRESAALAWRAGLDRATAWRSVTSAAATMIGFGSTLGRIAPGFDADLVLWSGDPLSIASRPVAVYLDGELSSKGDRN